MRGPFHYDLLSGPTSSIGDAMNHGQQEFTGQTVPEPSSFLLAGIAVLAELGV